MNGTIEALLVIIKGSDLMQTNLRMRRATDIIIRSMNDNILKAIKKDASFHWMIMDNRSSPRWNSSIDIEDGWATIRLDRQRQLGYIFIDLSEIIVVSIESTFRSELVDVAYLDWTDPHLIEIIQELLSNRCYTYLNEAANKIRTQYKESVQQYATIKQAYECQKAMAAIINNAIDKIRTAA